MLKLVILIALLKQIEKYIPVPGDLAVFVSWMVCVFLGYLSFIYIEKPITKWLKRNMDNREAMKILSETVSV